MCSSVHMIVCFREGANFAHHRLLNQLVNYGCENIYLLQHITLDISHYMMYVVAVLCNSMPGQRIKVHWILEEISCMRDMYKTQTKVRFNRKRENHVKRYF